LDKSKIDVFALALLCVRCSVDHVNIVLIISAHS
jgi:hypothetical protein